MFKLGPKGRSSVLVSFASLVLIASAAASYYFVYLPRHRNVEITLSNSKASVEGRATQFGVLYEPWHCITVRRELYDISEIFAGRQTWGPIPEFHWWDEPQNGYYCLSEQPDVLRDHAIKLRDAGVDFIVFDASNNSKTDANQTSSAILEPMQKLLEEWSKIDNAPKVVPWFPLTTDADTPQAMLNLLAQYPSMRFIYQGKPMAMAVRGGDGGWSYIDENRYQALSSEYTMRRMWGENLSDLSQWSFISKCQTGFKASQGTADCNQIISTNNGQLDEISISMAYQESWMSDKRTATPRFGGATFVKQFQTLFNNPSTPIALLTAWNGWMSQRICTNANYSLPLTTGCTNETYPNGDYIIADEYDQEYSIDIEPAKNERGDFYYQLMKSCINKFRQGDSGCNTSVSFTPWTGGPSNQKPRGSVDGAETSGTLVGWAYDPDHPNASVTLHVYADAPPGSANSVFVGSVTADLPRSLSGIAGNHGFRLAVPVNLRDNRDHKIYAFVFDLDDNRGGFNVSLPGVNSFNLQPPTNQTPVGSFDGIDSADNAVGWAYDPDHPTTSIDVHFYTCQANTTPITLVGNIKTNKVRNDVNGPLDITGAHGFEFPIPSQYRDGHSHRICAYAVDEDDASQNKNLSGNPVTFTLATPSPTVTTTPSPTVTTTPTPSTTSTTSPTPVPLSGDVNDDGSVNLFDFNILVRDYGKTGEYKADLNRDGTVNLFDFNILVRNYGKVR